LVSPSGKSAASSPDKLTAIDDAAWERSFTADSATVDLESGIHAEIDIPGSKSLRWSPDGKSTYLQKGEPNDNQRIRNYTNGYTVADEFGETFTAQDMSRIGATLSTEDGEYARWRLQKLNAEYDSSGFGHTVSEAFDGWFGHKVNPLRTANQEQERWELRHIVGSYLGAHPEILASTFAGVDAAAGGVVGAAAVLWGRNRSEADRQYAYRLAGSVDQGIQAYGSMRNAAQNNQAVQSYAKPRAPGLEPISIRDGQTRPAPAGLAGSYAQQKVSPPSVTYNINSSRSAAPAGANSSAAVTAESAAARKSGFIFRGDERGPEVIFNEGFQPRGTNTNLYDYAASNVPSVYVPATTSPNVARWFAEIQDGGFVYTMRGQPQGLDVNAILGKMSPHPTEFEIAVPGGIHPSDIMGARAVTPNGTFTGPFIKNPTYTP
jgi:hypothetical protein